MTVRVGTTLEKCKKVVGSTGIDHNSDSALRSKLRIDLLATDHPDYAELYTHYEHIMHLQRNAEMLNEVVEDPTADGGYRIASYNYRGEKCWYEYRTVRRGAIEYKILGVDQNGYYRDGEPGFLKAETDGGYNLDGFRLEHFPGYRRRVAVDREGYNEFGFNRAGRNREGFTKNGVDPEGYDRQGYSVQTGANRAGFLRSGLHIETKTRFNPEGFDVEGYDVNGRNRQGELEPSIALTLEFLAQAQTRKAFAASHNMDTKTLRNRFKTAIQRLPELESRLAKHREAHPDKSFMAIVVEIRDHAKHGMAPEKLWQAYHKLDTAAVIRALSPQDAYALFANSLYAIDPKSSEMIHTLARVFNSRDPQEIAGFIQQLRIKLHRAKNQQSVDLIEHLGKLKHAVLKHYDMRLYDLYTGFSFGWISKDETIMHEITPDDVDSAIARIDARGGVRSRKGVYEEIVSAYR